MAVIDRFNRGYKPIEFDPISAEDIMGVAVGKQMQEDNAIATGNEYLNKLNEFQATGADAERINARKAELENSLNSITDSMMKDGVNSRLVNKLTTLKRNMDKEMSLSGDIGQASNFLKKEQAAKKNFYNQALKTWDKDKADIMWQNHAKKQSAFNEDGTFNMDYAELGAPDFTTPEQYMDTVFAKLGKSTYVDENGVEVTTNEDNIRAALQSAYAQFTTPGTPEYNIAQGLGWTDEIIQYKLEQKAMSLVSRSEDNSANEKMALAQAKASSRNGTNKGKESNDEEKVSRALSLNTKAQEVSENQINSKVINNQNVLAGRISMERDPEKRAELVTEYKKNDEIVNNVVNTYKKGKGKESYIKTKELLSKIPGEVRAVLEPALETGEYGSNFKNQMLLNIAGDLGEQGLELSWSEASNDYRFNRSDSSGLDYSAAKVIKEYLKDSSNTAPTGLGFSKRLEEGEKKELFRQFLEDPGSVSPLSLYKLSDEYKNLPEEKRLEIDQAEEEIVRYNQNLANAIDNTNTVVNMYNLEADILPNTSAGDVTHLKKMNDNFTKSIKTGVEEVILSGMADITIEGEKSGITGLYEKGVNEFNEAIENKSIPYGINQMQNLSFGTLPGGNVKLEFTIPVEAEREVDGKTETSKERKKVTMIVDTRSQDPRGVKSNTKIVNTLTTKLAQLGDGQAKTLARKIAFQSDYNANPNNRRNESVFSNSDANISYINNRGQRSLLMPPGTETRVRQLLNSPNIKTNLYMDIGQDGNTAYKMSYKDNGQIKDVTYSDIFANVSNVNSIQNLDSSLLEAFAEYANSKNIDLTRNLSDQDKIDLFNEMLNDSKTPFQTNSPETYLQSI